MYTWTALVSLCLLAPVFFEAKTAAFIWIGSLVVAIVVTLDPLRALHRARRDRDVEKTA